MHKSLISVAALLTVIVGLGQWAAYAFASSSINFALPLMLIAVGIVTFFGILVLPSDKDWPPGEARIRLSVTATLLMVYVTYFGTVVFWQERISELEKEMVSTLTTMLAVVLPFYFGSSVALDIASKRFRGSDAGPDTGQHQDASHGPGTAGAAPGQ